MENGDDLDISPVYDHLDIIEKPNTEKKKEIVIPKEKKKEDKDVEEKDTDEERIGNIAF